MADRDKKIRLAAIKVLARFGPDAAYAAKRLIAAFDDPDSDVAKEAILALCQVSAESTETVQALLDAVIRPGRGKYAARMLKQLGNTDAAAGLLAKALESKDAATRRNAVEALTVLGPAAAPAQHQPQRGSRSKSMTRTAQTIAARVVVASSRSICAVRADQKTMNVVASTTPAIVARRRPTYG